MDPIIIVLFQLYLGKMQNLEVGARPPSETRVGVLGPCAPLFRHLYHR